MILLLPLLAILIGSCSPGHLGGNEIAFVRNGHLWTIDPDGSNAFEVVASDTPVIGYAWSPDHHIFVFRLLDGSFASTNAGKHPDIDPILGIPGDLPGSLNTVGLDGGTPITITTSISGHSYSNAWWNSSGSRLLYREVSFNTTNISPIDAQWWVSQNDQPNNIARKSLPQSYSIPSFSPDSSLAIGNSSQGIFTTTLAGADFRLLLQGALPGHPLSATIERVLWQPAHNQPALLYAILASPSSLQPAGSSAPTVDLVVNGSHGQLSTIATCACTQFAWSPDGNSILFSTGATYTVYTLATHAAISFMVETGSVPYWSPNSQFILLDGLHTLSLFSLASQRLQLLLSDGGAITTPPPLPGEQAFLQPASNSLWAADSQHFLVLTRSRMFWQNQPLHSGNGLYIATIDGAGHLQGPPALVDSGNDSQPGWSYEDPNTSFLF